MGLVFAELARLSHMHFWLYMHPLRIYRMCLTALPEERMLFRWYWVNLCSIGVLNHLKSGSKVYIHIKLPFCYIIVELSVRQSGIL